MQKTEIIPAILAKDLQELETKLALLKEACSLLETSDKPKVVQIDICNNDFFENFDFDILKKYSDTFDFELDLMNLDIDKIIERLNDLSCSEIKRLIFHYADWGEKFSILEFDNSFQEIALAVLPALDLEEIKPYLEKINFIQFMGLNSVGVQGGVFNPAVIQKIADFRKTNPEMLISVDGGVSLENALALINAGASRLVSGSAIFGQNNSPQEILDNIKKFNNIEK